MLRAAFVRNEFCCDSGDGPDVVSFPISSGDLLLADFGYFLLLAGDAVCFVLNGIVRGAMGQGEFDCLMKR